MNVFTSHFDRQNDSFAEQVKRQSKAAGVCLLLFDRNKMSNNISFMHNHDIPQSIASAYAENIYRYDPLLPHRHLPHADQQQFTGGRYEGLGQQHINDTEADQYWNYLGKVGFYETAASVQSLSENIFLVVGLLCASQTQHICIDRAMSSMERWLHQSSNHMIESSVRHYYGHASQAPDSVLIDLSCLTNREAEVVQELIKGKSNKLISAALNLSEYTVENHLRRIYKKFDVHNRTSLLAIIHAVNGR